MKLLPNEIHFDCPKCNRPMSGDKRLLGEMINCPDCNEPFIPIPRIPAEPNEIHFICPRCKCPMSGDKSLLAEFVTCPDCQQNFKPVPRKPEPAHAAAPKVKDEAECIIERLNQQKQHNKIRNRPDEVRNRADFFENLSGLFLVLGICAMVFSIFSTLGDNNAMVGWLIMAGLIGTAFWLYLVSQIMHIRANTEK